MSLQPRWFPHRARINGGYTIVEMYSAKCFWQVSYQVCAAAQASQSVIRLNRSSVRIFSHTWTAPLLWMSSANYWTESRVPGVSHWSRAALHRSLASGARQVKHNKLVLSQTQGIIYLDPSQSLWLHFSNTLDFLVPVALQHLSMCSREQEKDEFNWAFYMLCFFFFFFFFNCSSPNTTFLSFS